MWVLIDNYDSFTWILHDYLLQTGHECAVYKNDGITVAQLQDMQPERIIISPGPETPVQAGISLTVIGAFHATVPILGVCLGHQALGMYFGAQLLQVPPMHGKTSGVTHDNHPLFRNIPTPFTAMRYHSLAIDASHADDGLYATAHAIDDGVVMGLAHRDHPCLGVQFHPESVGTEHGLHMIKNWAGMQWNAQAKSYEQI